MNPGPLAPEREIMPLDQAAVENFGQGGPAQEIIGEIRSIAGARQHACMAAFIARMPICGSHGRRVVGARDPGASQRRGKGCSGN